MVRQTKRFKKGLNKKVLSAILAASMIMTSSSFAFAAPVDGSLSDDTATATEANAPSNEEAGIATLSGDPESAEELGNNAKTASTFDDFEASLELDGVSYDVNVEDGNPNTDPEKREFEYKGGNEVKPEVVIYDPVAKKELVYGVDYQLTYANNTEVSAKTKDYASVTIEFDQSKYGNIGDVVIEYNIVPREIKEVNATVRYAVEESLVYNGEEQYPTIESVTVRNGSEEYELSPEDYVIQEIDKNDNYSDVGEHRIRVVGTGNYDGVLDSSYTYSITPADLSNETSRVSIDPVAFSSNKTSSQVAAEVRKSIAVYDGVNDRYLEKREYTIKFMDEETGEYDLNVPSNANMGVHQVRIYGALNYDPNSYVDATYEVIREDSLQMLINQHLKDSNGIKVKGVTLGTRDGLSGAIYEYDGTDHFVDNADVDITFLTDNQYDVTTVRADWTNAGTYYITVEGKNNYAGDTATIPVYVTSKSLTSVSATATQGTHRSGEAGSIEVLVRDTKVGDKGTTLKEGVDYVYEVVKKAMGKQEVHIKGIGNYKETIKRDVNVSDKLYLNDESITAEVTKSYVYTGDEIKPAAADIKVVEKDINNEYTITDADFYVKDYRNNKNAGEATVIIAAKDTSEYYTGEREITFTIGGLDFAETFEMAPIDDVEVGRTWDNILNQIKVKYQSNGATYASWNDTKGRCEFEILKDGKRVTDFTKKITETGEYLVKATPVGNRYAGSLVTTFTVKGVDIAQNTTVSAIEDQVYTGEAIEPKVTVKNDNMTLEEGKDYTLSYSGNVEGGTAVVIINGIGNYSGTVEKEFTITQGQQEITMTNPLQERDLANGSRTTTSKACTLKLGYALEDKNMSLSYATSDPSVATVNNGKITYEGVGECTITVTAKETNNCKADTLEIKVKVGKPGTPTFTPTVSSKTAKKSFVVTSSTVKGADGFEVQYSIRPDWWKATTKDFSNIGAGGKLYRQTLTTYHSNKTYYIHVRAYQVVNGEKVYSEWSPMKTAKTK